jgi:hypothetical protein
MSDWQRVQDLFLDSVDLPVEERVLFLQSSCKGDPELFAEVESLITADRDSEVVIDAAIHLEAALFFDAQVLVGERLGMGRLGMVDPAPDGVAESLASLEEAHKLIEPIAGANSSQPRRQIR